MHFARWLTTVPLRLRSLLKRNQVEQELAEEIRYHIERHIEETHLATGCTPEEARRSAMRAFHGVEQRKEECRDARRMDFIEHLIRDVRYAVRGLIKDRGFSCAAILTLSLGIGANTAVFTMVNSILLRQLSFSNADRLVWIWSTRTDRDKAFYSIANFLDTRDQAQTLDDIAGFANWGVNLTGSGEAERLVGVRISANAFQMLGVDPALGRTLLPSDGTAEASHVILISDGLWKRRFGRDEHIVGQSLLLNGAAYTVVGVLPTQFTLPNAEVEVASPLVFETDPQRSDRGSNFLRTFGRLKPGVKPAQAQAELASITERLKRQYPDDNAKHAAPRVLTLRDEVVGNYRALLWTMLAAVAIVLLIACTNLANMLLGRSAGRRKDFAIRAALGGTRAQLMRELITASLVLATAGGALGLFLASWGIRLLLAIGPADLPRLREVTLDWHVLVFTACISVAAGVLFGLTPSVQATRVDLNEVLKGSGRTAVEWTGVGMRSALVITEVALSLLLLVSAGLLVRSFINLQSVSSGVETQNLLSVRISLPASRYSQHDTMAAFVEHLIRDVRNTPGVQSASIGSVLPLSGMNTRADFTVSGRPPATETEKPAAQNRWIAPGYFQTMAIPIIRGRDFNEFDTGLSQPVAVVDEALAQRQFPNDDPIGKHLRVGDAGPNVREVEIVGIVGNVKHFSLNDPPTATYYSPIAQVPQPALGFLFNGMSLVVRTKSNPLALSDDVRRRIRSLDKDVPASSVQTMDQSLAISIAPRRFNLLLIEIFAAAALILAALGLYSVLAYAVTQRRREIGIRMALGAKASDVFKQVLREGMALTLIGEAAGIAAALLLTRFLSTLLYDITPTDPSTFAVLGLVLTATAFIACAIPAHRATRVDPIISLKQN